MALNAASASLINAVVLVALGLWGYFASESPSPTAFIPVVFGAILLALNRGVAKENKAIAHVAVIVTLLILIGLFMPLRGAMNRSDTGAIVRVVIMMLSTVLAMVFFVRSFIEARRKRQEG